MRPAARAAGAIAAAGIASAVYQRAAEAADRRRFPPPGRLADIGGRRIHLLAMGEGTPAVVIVPSLGGTVLEWVRVQRAAATKTTVCVVDQAGIGWSDPAPLGGIVARRFQARFPGDVTGMLLVDSSHEEQSRRFGWRDGTGSQLWRAARYLRSAPRCCSRLK